MKKTKIITYWVTTIMVVFTMFSGGVAELMLRPENVQGLSHVLGYPLYVLPILGAWKVLGCIAILIPRFPRLKEWAYAGIFFNMTGAVISNAAVGNPGWHVVVDLLITGLVVTSWALRPQSRTLGVQ